jgi:predicted site-specific integrase-resolvase
MADPMGISEARRRLFELVDRVLDHPDDLVYIEHRDRSERVALVSEARLARLERVAATAGPPRSLVCSAALVGNATVDDVVAAVRGSTDA